MTLDELSHYQVRELGYGKEWLTLTKDGEFNHRNLIAIRSVNQTFEALIFTDGGFVTMDREWHPYIVAAAFPHRVPEVSVEYV